MFYTIFLALEIQCQEEEGEAEEKVHEELVITRFLEDT